MDELERLDELDLLDELERPIGERSSGEVLGIPNNEIINKEVIGIPMGLNITEGSSIHPSDLR